MTQRTDPPSSNSGPLAETLQWLTDGHASDLALSALADGQDDILAPELGRHVDGCASCGERFAALATEGFLIADTFAAAAKRESWIPVRDGSAALKAMLAGFFALGVTFAWRFGGHVGEVLRVFRLAPKVTPVVHKHAHSILDQALAWYVTGNGVFVSLAAALLLVFVGVLVARSQVAQAREVMS